MRVRDLYGFIKDSIREGTLNLDSDVIAVGEYNYGEFLEAPSILKMNLIDGEEIVKENAEVLALSIDTYLYEHTDLGCSRMWIDEENLKDLKDNNMVE